MRRLRHLRTEVSETYYSVEALLFYSDITFRDYGNIVLEIFYGKIGIMDKRKKICWEETMQYQHTIHGKFLSRPNRFIARVEIEGKPETVHVKNTGRCRELLLPGAEVVLEISDNPNRKTKYDLISVYKENLGWVNIDSQAPNKAVKEWLEKQSFTKIKPEYTYGDSRIDFYMEKDGEKYLMEVKGCTLAVDGVGYFPDAPTERGIKHLRELTKAVRQGYHCYAAFVIQMEHIREVRPNTDTHPEFGLALEEAVAAGVELLHLECSVTDHTLVIKSREL